MGNLQGFNANEVQPNDGFELVPPGDYEAVIVASEMKKTKAGTGSYLDLQLQITSGPMQNRKLFDKINVQNPNPTAQQIGQGTLSSICRAVNVLTPSDSSELHMRPLRITVGTRKREDTGDLQNVVKSYKPRNGVAAVKGQVGTNGPVGPSVASASVRAPWGNN